MEIKATLFKSFWLKLLLIILMLFMACSINPNTERVTTEYLIGIKGPHEFNQHMTMTLVWESPQLVTGQGISCENDVASQFWEASPIDTIPEELISRLPWTLCRVKLTYKVISASEGDRPLIEIIKLEKIR